MEGVNLQQEGEEKEQFLGISPKDCLAGSHRSVEFGC